MRTSIRSTFCAVMIGKCPTREMALKITSSRFLGSRDVIIRGNDLTGLCRVLRLGCSSRSRQAGCSPPTEVAFSSSLSRWSIRLFFCLLQCIIPLSLEVRLSVDNDSTSLYRFSIETAFFENGSYPSTLSINISQMQVSHHRYVSEGSRPTRRHGTLTEMSTRRLDLWYRVRSCDNYINSSEAHRGASVQSKQINMHMVEARYHWLSVLKGLPCVNRR
ncbi:hypothetical protein HD554DRAFT_793521 [Boletus coccyginus]|nr:hypothetical protein HD554DRAFT_793521 [Boletus coccyginus]